MFPGLTENKMTSQIEKTYHILDHYLKRTRENQIENQNEKYETPFCQKFNVLVTI